MNTVHIILIKRSYLLDDFISLKFQKKQNESMVIEVMLPEVRFDY